MLKCLNIHCKYLDCDIAKHTHTKNIRIKVVFFFFSTVYSKHSNHILVSLHQLLAHRNPVQILAHIQLYYSHLRRLKKWQWPCVSTKYVSVRKPGIFPLQMTMNPPIQGSVNKTGLRIAYFIKLATVLASSPAGRELQFPQASE